ncbi:MAG: ferrous iron transport protein A [Spirochaetaceae bacterium]|nr:ferrous iron transport protein A [Spirochaetaceae bacterium]
MNLKELGIGKSGRVITVGGEKVLRRRLLDMGITPGTIVTLKKVAPMGDPVELLIRGYVLSLRMEDAQKITIEEVQT